MKGGKWFAQIVTNAPLFEGRVLASEIRPTRDEAISAAMAAAGVTELVPPERSLRFVRKPESSLAAPFRAPTTLFERMRPPKATGIAAALLRLSLEVAELTAVLREH